MRIGLTVLFVHFCYTAVAFQSSKIATVRFVNKEGHSIRSVQLELRSGEIQKILTTSSGYEIHLKSDFEKGDLLVEASGYRTQTIPIIFTEKDDLLVLGNWLMQEMVAAEVEAPLLRMSDLELWTASDDREQLGVALQAQRDLFLSTAAFQFGSAFFRLRGLDASHRSVRINGIAMNHFMTGRPNWGQWGGLNDFTNVAGKTNYGLSPAQFDMGGVLGSLQINLRPSQMRLGSKFSQAFSNATYQFRSMVSHVGHYNQWDFALLGSTRVAKEGYREGTPYQAFSLLAFLERQWNSVHQTWGGFIYTPNSSGKSAPLTQEVFDLKGNKYNPYWGWQKGRIRNARIKTTKIPSFFLTHRYQPTSSSIWHVNIGVQLGQTAYSRLQHQGH